MPEIILPHDHGQPMEHELTHMPSVENFQTVANVCRQLGDGQDDFKPLRFSGFCGREVEEVG